MNDRLPDFSVAPFRGSGVASHTAHRRFSSSSEYKTRRMQVDDVLMAVLVIALIAWML